MNTLANTIATAQGTDLKTVVLFLGTTLENAEILANYDVSYFEMQCRHAAEESEEELTFH